MNLATEIFTEAELDALQELVNVGFGRAGADLSEAMNLHAILSAPNIFVLRSSDLKGFIERELSHPDDYRIVEQFFSGKIRGLGFLIVPHTERNNLFRLFDGELDSPDPGYSVEMLEREALIEIGNIIIGSCVGKIADLLDDNVMYRPPQYFNSKLYDITAKNMFGSDDNVVISFKTVFSFEKEDISGYLFLVSDFETIKWLKVAIKNFMRNYEEC